MTFSPPGCPLTHRSQLEALAAHFIFSMALVWVEAGLTLTCRDGLCGGFKKPLLIKNTVNNNPHQH
jgi:hypothetical protein